MTQLDDKYDSLAWGSHLAPLLACICQTGGPVLELGIGHFSTPILHSVCTNLGRKLVSVEDNEEWYKAFRHYDFGVHCIFHKSYDELGFLWKEKWGVVFIDNSPGGERRKIDFMNAITTSDYVVVHDYELDNLESIGPVISEMEKLQKISACIYNAYTPPTLIASLKKGLPLI